MYDDVGNWERIINRDDRMNRDIYEKSEKKVILNSKLFILNFYQ